jgi:hypothetical protein
MRPFIALAAADLAAAATTVIWLDAEGMGQGVSMPIDAMLFTLVLALMAFSPVVFMAYPAWALLRSRQLEKAALLAVIGSVIGAMYYVLLVYAGIDAPSDRPMTFAENLFRPFRLFRIAGAAISGSIAAVVFRYVMAAKRGH